MHKINLFIVVVAIAAIAIFSYVKASECNRTLSILDMDKVEAIAGCEVSSDHSKNTGYCVTLHGTNIDVCTSDGPGNATRCSGNY